MSWTWNNKGALIVVVGVVIVYSLLVQASQSRASNRKGTLCRRCPVRMGRTEGTRPMDWKSLSLLVVSMLLLVLTWVLSDVDQPKGIVFLGIGLFFAAILSFFWYVFRPNAGWCDSKKFFSLLAANLIPFVLFGFLVFHIPAVGVVFGGLFGVVLAYTVWSQAIGKSIWDLMLDIFRACLILFTVLSIALTLEGLGSLTGLDALDSIGRWVFELFRGS